MSDLANRLAVAAWSEMKAPPYSNWSYDQLRPMAKSRVYRTVAAVLRELDAEVGHRILSDGEPIDLAVLAEVIEKGEQA